MNGEITKTRRPNRQGPEMTEGVFATGDRLPVCGPVPPVRDYRTEEMALSVPVLIRLTADTR